MNKLATTLLLALFSLTSLHAFEDGVYYYLSAQFPGEEKVLSAVKSGQVAKAELALPRDKKGSANQWWKFTSLGNGYYRLTTKALGDGYSLDVVGDDPENDQIQLVKTEDVSGQAWKIAEEKDGYFRLTTQFKGPSMSLDVCNEGDKTKMVGLIGSTNSLGQLWMFRKTSGGPPAMAKAKKGKKVEVASVATAAIIDPEIKGPNVTKITYQGPARVQPFAQTGPKRWTSAQVAYREVDRDEFSVYLVRAKAEDERVQIDLYTKKVTFRGQGPEVSYPILSASGGGPK